MSKIFILFGPTASGKSHIIQQLVEIYNNLAIINADSKQVYKEIPIITAQPPQSEIKHYSYQLYSHISIAQNYDVTAWVNDVVQAIKEAFTHNKIPVLVGGTGFYLNALINGMDDLPAIDLQIKKKTEEIIASEGSQRIYQELIENDPQVAHKININDFYRITRAYCTLKQTGSSIFSFYNQKKNLHFLKEQFLISVINPPRDLLYQQINNRFDDMMIQGVIKELQVVKNLDLPSNLPFYKAHGLPEFIQYFDGLISLEKAIEKTKQNTRNYAKRQVTWAKHQLENAQYFEHQQELILYIKNQLMHIELMVENPAFLN